METSRLTTRELAHFLLAATVPALVLQALAVSHGGLKGGQPYLLATMWVPGLAALLSSRSARTLALRALRRFSWRDLVPALLVGWALLGVQQLLLWASGGGVWSAGHFPLAPAGQGITGVHGLAMVLGVGAQSWPYFALNLIVTITLASVTNGVFAGLGEELGWRAVLQPTLESRLGRLRGTLLVAAIWAAWHLPANLAGYNDPVHPVATALVLFPVAVLVMSVGFAWVASRHGSVWPAAIAHGANNTLAAGFLLKPASWAADNVTMMVASVLVGAVVAVIFLRRGADTTSVQTTPALGAART